MMNINHHEYATTNQDKKDRFSLNSNSKGSLLNGGGKSMSSQRSGSGHKRDVIFGSFDINDNCYGQRSNRLLKNYQTSFNRMSKPNFMSNENHDDKQTLSNFYTANQKQIKKSVDKQSVKMVKISLFRKPKETRQILQNQSTDKRVSSISPRKYQDYFSDPENTQIVYQFQSEIKGKKSLINRDLNISVSKDDKTP